jgi:hypothetical protein
MSESTDWYPITVWRRVVCCGCVVFVVFVFACLVLPSCLYRLIHTYMHAIVTFCGCLADGMKRMDVVFDFVYSCFVLTAYCSIE